MNPGFVVAMGLITVFFGLIVLIIVCELMGAICKRTVKPAQSAPKAAPAPAAAPIVNRQELVAAVSAAIAEEMGADVSAIRILSLKKI